MNANMRQRLNGSSAGHRQAPMCGGLASGATACLLAAGISHSDGCDSSDCHPHDDGPGRTNSLTATFCSSMRSQIAIAL